MMTSDLRYQVIPLIGIPIVDSKSDVARLIVETADSSGVELLDGDIVVVAHTLVSKAEGCVFPVDEVEVSDRARQIAQRNDVDPVKVQLALQESVAVLRESPVLITRTRHGIITDYSGVDRSNVPEGSYITLPRDPDASAAVIKSGIESLLQVAISVIIADTHGRPWRKGAINVAVGVAGMSPFTQNADKKDLYDRRLRMSLVCLVDELSSAAELVMGQADEGIPVVVIRGVSHRSSEGSAREIMRTNSENLFH